MRWIVSLALIFAFPVSTAMADSRPSTGLAVTIDGIVSRWMADNSIADAEVAIAHDGTVEGSFAHGWQPTERRPVASLSKAITGVCIADLIAAKKLSFMDNLGTLLASFFERHGEPADPRFKTITVEELLTHRSGLPRNAVDDALDHTMEASVVAATRVKLVSDPGTAVAYSDTGYLILGLVAQQVAKKPYAQQCASVFTEAGLPTDVGAVDPTLSARAPNGGWSISAEDYAKFLHLFSDEAKSLGPVASEWMTAQPGDHQYAAGPCPRFSGQPTYGLGLCIRQAKYGPEFYHDGLLHHDKYYPETGGSFFFVNAVGDAAVVIFSGENSGKAYRSLETAVIDAMTSAKNHASDLGPQ